MFKRWRPIKAVQIKVKRTVYFYYCVTRLKICHFVRSVRGGGDKNMKKKYEVPLEIANLVSDERKQFFLLKTAIRALRALP